MICHSGGAEGADYFWGLIGEEYGVETRHYFMGSTTKFNAPHGNFKISAEDEAEGAIEAARAAKHNWGYQLPKMKLPVLIRDWAQSKYSDAVFAIGEIVIPGQRVFPHKEGDTRVAIHECVAGGTGYACTMSILHEKPVYVFDQYKEAWFRYDFDMCEFVELPSAPKLTENFAGIGTRYLNDAGKKAIRDCYEVTFNETSQV